MFAAHHLGKKTWRKGSEGVKTARISKRSKFHVEHQWYMKGTQSPFRAHQGVTYVCPMYLSHINVHIPLFFGWSVKNNNVKNQVLLYIKKCLLPEPARVWPMCDHVPVPINILLSQCSLYIFLQDQECLIQFLIFRENVPQFHYCAVISYGCYMSKRMLKK